MKTYQVVPVAEARAQKFPPPDDLWLLVVRKQDTATKATPKSEHMFFETEDEVRQFKLEQIAKTHGPSHMSATYFEIQIVWRLMDDGHWLQYEIDLAFTPVGTGQ